MKLFCDDEYFELATHCVTFEGFCFSTDSLEGVDYSGIHIFGQLTRGLPPMRPQQCVWLFMCRFVLQLGRLKSFAFSYLIIGMVSVWQAFDGFLLEEFRWTFIWSKSHLFESVAGLVSGWSLMLVARMRSLSKFLRKFREFSFCLRTVRKGKLQKDISLNFRSVNFLIGSFLKDILLKRRLNQYPTHINHCPSSKFNMCFISSNRAIH